MKQENEERASRALAALYGYNKGEPDESDIIDLLTDLMHYCASEKLWFNRCFRIAQDHFKVEA